MIAAIASMSSTDQWIMPITISPWRCGDHQGEIPEGQGPGTAEPVASNEDPRLLPVGRLDGLPSTDDARIISWLSRAVRHDCGNPPARIHGGAYYGFELSGGAIGSDRWN